MIRVLQLVTSLAGGGVGSVIMNYYRNMDSGFIFDFVVNERSNSPFEKEIEEKGGHIYIVRPLRNGFFRYIKDIIHVLKNNRGSILHSNYGEKSLFFLFFSVFFRYKKRILHVHSSERPEGKFEKIRRKILSKLCILLATNKIACGSEAAKWFYGKKYKKKKVEILKNAIDIESYLFSEQKRECQRNYYGFGNLFVIGNVGRLSYPKNHRFMLKVFFEFHKRFNNSCLVLAGTGELENELKKIAENYNIQNNVFFLGLVNNVKDLLNSFDVFLMPSISEGVPVAAIEALANGLHVVCSSSVTKEINIENSIDFLSLNGSIETWINSLMNSKRSGDYNLSFLREKGFDIKQEANHLEKIYL